MRTLSVIALISLTHLSSALVVKTPVTRQYVQDYRNSLPNDYSVVQNGGWNTIEQKATYALAKENLEKWAVSSDDFPANTTYNVRDLVLNSQLAADPKGALLELAKSLNQKGTTNFLSSDEARDQLQALLVLLRAQGRGFESDLVDGDWTLVLQQQGDKSPKAQKLVGRRERPGKSMSTFAVGDSTFSGDIRFWKGLGKVTSTVQYKPTSDKFETTPGSKKIVLRRIQCDITSAGLQFWKLPRLSLSFLKRTGGYLDFVYLDRDIRVTTGNRGGIFVHARPEYAKEMLL